VQKPYLQIQKSRNLQTLNLKNTKYPKPITLNPEKTQQTLNPKPIQAEKTLTQKTQIAKPLKPR